MKSFPLNSEQLELDLFPGIPWNGRSPRGLTRPHYSVFLRPEPPRHEVKMHDPAQIVLSLAEAATLKKKPLQRLAAGAPLLIGVKKTRRGRVLELRRF